MEEHLMSNRGRGFIQWINLYLVDSAVHFVSTHPLDSYLCIGYRYAPLEQLGSVI